jgi:carnitine-CoA ligase
VLVRRQDALFSPLGQWKEVIDERAPEGRWRGNMSALSRYEGDALPSATTIPALLDRSAVSHRDVPILDFADGQLSYSDLLDSSNRIANALLVHGASFGDRIACILDNCADAVVCWMAINRIGAIWVPINAALKGDFLSHQLNDVGSKIVIAEGDYAERVLALGRAARSVELLFHRGGRPANADKAKIAVRRFSELQSDDASVPNSPVLPSDIACLLFTGGTTGPSKACMITHATLVNQARQQIELQGRTSAETVWSPLPLFHANAIVAGVLASMVVGGTASFSDRFSVSRFWPEVERSGAKIVSLLGSMLSLVAQAPMSDVAQRCFGQVRLVRGAPFTAELRSEWAQKFGVERLGTCAYGLTEASTITSLPYDDPGVPGTAGRRNRFFETIVVDADDVELKGDVVGEILCRPRVPNMMFAGYWNRPEATVAATRNLWFHTGDYGRFDDSESLHFVDRKKDYLRRKGENISSVEVERVLAKHPDVSESAVVGVPSDFLEEEIKATIVLRPGAAITEAALALWAADRLPYFAVPRYIEFGDSLPRNEVGRVQKYLLRESGASVAWDREAAGVQIEKR